MIAAAGAACIIRAIAEILGFLGVDLGDSLLPSRDMPCVGSLANISLANRRLEYIGDWSIAPAPVSGAPAEGERNLVGASCLSTDGVLFQLFHLGCFCRVVLRLSFDSHTMGVVSLSLSSWAFHKFAIFLKPRCAGAGAGAADGGFHACPNMVK